MADTNKLRTEFFNAQRAVISSLFAPHSQRNQAYVQMALDRMTRAFNKLTLSTLKPYTDDIPTPPPSQELLCVYAINVGDDWNGSKWQVMFVNCEPIANPMTVGEFTRQMIADGWKVFSPHGDCEPHTFQTPDGEPVYPLYFCRALPSQLEDPAKVTDLPELNEVGMLLSTN